MPVSCQPLTAEVWHMGGRETTYKASRFGKARISCTMGDVGVSCFFAVIMVCSDTGRSIFPGGFCALSYFDGQLGYDY